MCSLAGAIRGIRALLRPSTRRAVVAVFVVVLVGTVGASGGGPIGITGVDPTVGGGSAPVELSTADPPRAARPAAQTQAPRLNLTTVSNQTVLPGETTVYRFGLTNEGNTTAYEVGLWLRVDNGTLYFGSSLNRNGRVGFYIPELQPGERKVLEVRLGVDTGSLSGTYLVVGDATYRDQIDTVRRTSWLATGVTVEGSAGPNVDAVSPARPRNGTLTATDGYSPAPSRTITAMPVSKSAIPAAESSARPTPSSASPGAAGSAVESASTSSS